MTLNRGGKIFLTALLLACGGALGASREFYLAAMSSPYFAFVLVAVVIIHLRAQPSWRDVACVLGCAAGFGALAFLVLDFPQRVVSWLSFIGLGSLLVMGLRAVWEERAENRKVLLLAFAPALLFVVSDYFASDLLSWTEAAQPRVLDLYLLSFDASLYYPFAFKAGQWFQQWPWLRMVSVLFYVALPVSLAVAYAGQLVRIRERALPAMAAFLMAGPLGVVFYNFFPAIGPSHLLPQPYPWHPLPVEQASQLVLESLSNLAGPRNAIPSLHLAWVLLAWWCSKGLSRWERGITFLFLIFTGLATVGTGEHYVVDLIVAYPFALFLQGACAFFLPWRNRWRVTAICSGLGGLVAWLLALRYVGKFFWLTPVIPWVLSALTVALSILLHRRLQEAIEEHSGAADRSGEKLREAEVA
jgi:hypothetical protein